MSKNFEIIFREFMNSETFVVSRELLEDYKRQAAKEEQDRIVELLESFMPHLLLEDASIRDREAFAYAIWQFRFGLRKLIKGDGE